MSTTPPAGGAAAEGNKVLLIVGIVLGLIFPIGGLIIAIVLFVQRHTTWGLYVLGATIVGAVIGAAVYM